MVFSELRFALFFLVAFAVHWTLRGWRTRKAWLLICSAAFYAAWDFRFLGLVALSATVDFVAGGQIARSTSPRVRRAWLIFALAVSLGVLGYYKYAGWFAESGAALLQWLGFDVATPTLALFLPVGISFYTFQTLSYTIDVYRGDTDVTDSPLDFALYVMFFPQLVAGPIVRARDFLWQLAKPVHFDRIDVRGCLLLFLAGYVKKEFVASLLAGPVDTFFADPAAFDVASSWIAVTLYLVQLYVDVSSYADMANATSGLLGYRLCPNFDFPFFATDLAGFWRRWHISMSSWFRDYVFMPLGGSRGSEPAIALRLVFTMVVIGLWHGAQAHYVVFGLLHGAGLVVNRWWSRRPGRSGATSRFSALLGCIATLAFCLLTTPFFRSGAVAAEAGISARLIGLATGGTRSLGLEWLLVLFALAAVHGLCALDPRPLWWRRVPGWLFAPAFGAAMAFAVALGTPLNRPFIYFHF